MRAYRGRIVNPIAINEIEYIDDGLVVVHNGIIETYLKESKAIDQYLSRLSLDANNFELETVSGDSFLMPGFVDTHTHASQFINMGVGSELQLLDWLHTYTYPGERQFECPAFAERNYSLAVSATVGSGTTTCLYYGTIHTESTRILCDIVERVGQRGLVGKVCMDKRQFCPDYYVETTEQSVAETKKFIAIADRSGWQLVRPIITPRSALSCSRSLMRQLSSLAAEHSLLVQSHLSENLASKAVVEREFPEADSFTHVYAEYGLLGSTSVMAHCVYLSEAEIDLIRERNVGIAHCPSSNCNLRSGRMPLRKYIDLGLKIGLGTDVSGGSSASILRAIQDAYLVHKLASVEAADQRFVTYEELFYLATLGGATVLNMESRIGSFGADKCFDALIVRSAPQNRTRAVGSDTNAMVESKRDNWAEKCDQFYSYTLKESFENFMLNGCDSDILRVIVNGKIIK